LERATSSSDDCWLDRWLALIDQRAGGLPLLELGCGDGRDTEVLGGTGLRVVGIDLSPQAIDRHRAKHDRPVRPAEVGLGSCPGEDCSRRRWSIIDADTISDPSGG
jgi:SAM-dependent methyltransferase